MAWNDRLFPVTSVKSNFTYRNRMCAVCHGENDLDLVRCVVFLPLLLLTYIAFRTLRTVPGLILMNVVVSLICTQIIFTISNLLERAFSFFTSFLTSLQGVFIFFSFFTSRHVLSLFQSLFERRLTSNLIEASIKNNTKNSAVQQNDRSSDQ
ncbi:uncharacterized protein [Magallana gigas]|uniref:uncharacterized protein n=1 Tax=Magallana gigas TaxID=29159 RepID=UPI0033402150